MASNVAKTETAAPMPRKKSMSPGTIIGLSLGVVLAGIVALLAYRQFVPSPLAGIMRPSMLQRIEHPRGIEKLVAQMPTQDGNAGDDYWQIVTAYRSDPDTFDNFIHLDAGRLNAATVIPNQPFAALRAGAQKKQCRLYFEKTGPLNLFKSERWHIALFEKTADTVYNAVDVYRAQSDKQAERALWESYLLFGWHLCRHRVRPGVFNQGIQAQLNAIDNLLRIYHEGGQAEQIKIANDYKTALLVCQTKLRKKWKTIKIEKVHIGDLAMVIEKDADRMWKVEALLMLSFRRYTIANNKSISQFQVAVERDRAERLLNENAQSEDPYIAAAAKAALALTKEQVPNIDPGF